MLSFGIDASRAFCTIVRSDGLPSTSPPPWRAATSIWRASRANTLPRAASAAPFSCLMECHLECPLMQRTSWQEALVESQVARQLGMERRRPDRALADEHRVPVVGREHLDAAPHRLDQRARG